MVSAGANIVDNMSALQKVTVKYVYDSVRNPRPNIASQIRQLRKTIARMKTELRQRELNNK